MAISSMGGALKHERVEVRASGRGHFVHVLSPVIPSHAQLRACRGMCKWRLRPWAEPSSTSM